MRADRVARLPVLGLLERQRRGAPFVFAHLEGAERADADDERRRIGHSRTLPVFIAVMTAAIAAHSVPRNIGQKFWHMELISAA